MKTQRHYTTEKEILDEIERCKRLSAVWMETASSLDKLIADSLAGLPKLNEQAANELLKEINQWRDEAEQANRNSNKWAVRVSVTLKDTLARFRTAPLFDKDNLSVVEK